MGVVVISIGVVAEDPAQVVRAAEVFARTAAGLVLDGIDAQMSLRIPSEEERQCG